MALVAHGYSQPADRLNCVIGPLDCTLAKAFVWVTCDDAAFDGTFTKSDSEGNNWTELLPVAISGGGPNMRSFICRNPTVSAAQSFSSSTTSHGFDQGNVSCLLAFDEDIDPSLYDYYPAAGLLEVLSFPITTQVPGTIHTLAISITAIGAFHFGGPGGVSAVPDNGFVGVHQVPTVMVTALGNWYGVSDGINSAYVVGTDLSAIGLTWGLSDLGSPAGWLLFIPFTPPPPELPPGCDASVPTPLVLPPAGCADGGLPV